jgi:hypothetical protein
MRCSIDARSARRWRQAVVAEAVDRPGREDDIDLREALRRAVFLGLGEERKHLVGRRATCMS